MSDVEQMSDAPTPHARIWLTPPCCGNYEHGEVTWCQDAVNECGNCGAPPTEYVPAARLSTLTAALAAVTAERDALRDALEAMIASRDANSVEREQYKEPCDGNEWHGYWSPHSSMIESRFVAAARAALTDNHSAPVVEE